MPKEWDGVVSQLINRKFSRPLAKLLANRTTVSPNQVTILSFLVGILSALSFCFYQPILGGILAQTCSILDGVDGDLAILTNRITKFGGYLDSLLDRYADAAIYIGMIYYTFTLQPDIWCILAGTTALAGSLMVSYSRARGKSDLNIVFKKGFAGYAANRDVRLFIIMIGGILNLVFYTLILLATLTNLVVVTRIHIGWKNREENQ
ncbi:MAG: CDP-alcohol phosphatidyltransferase family protein [Candidatus Odinarchaeia archaeon]